MTNNHPVLTGRIVIVHLCRGTRTAYCPATDGTSAAHIEEEVIVTPKGAQIITVFLADALPIANRY